MTEVIDLQFGQHVPPSDSWVVVVKTANQDFEVVTSLMPNADISTVGAYPGLGAALDKARAAAIQLHLKVVYTVGVAIPPTVNSQTI